MKKPHITNGEWKPNGLYIQSESKRQIAQALLMNFEHDAKGRQIKDEEGEKNAIAIVTAVNNTYGKNINPEWIEGVINALKNMTMLYEIEVAKLDHKVYKESIAALKNIKFEQE